MYKSILLNSKIIMPITIIIAENMTVVHIGETIKIDIIQLAIEAVMTDITITIPEIGKDHTDLEVLAVMKEIIEIGVINQAIIMMFAATNPIANSEITLPREVKA